MASYVYRNIFGDVNGASQTERGSLAAARIPTHWATHHLYEVWSQIWHELGRAPTPGDLDLMRLYKVAARMTVQEVTRQGGKVYLTRFWGTDLTQTFGFEATGKHLIDVACAATVARLIPQFDAVVQSGGPCVFREELSSLRANTGAAFEVLHVPLASRDERNVERIVSVFDFDGRF